ncbi:lymphotactin-like [Meriones unguiculatus]|uniref:lymphotactin-like n=1 Tax=Meriones unguiculatus TaxID=10047 RepID=UPI000B4EB8A2|nr:lymphotactin-like [Meriones unguiculatus]
MRLLLLTFLGVCCLSICIVEGVGTEVLEKTTCVTFKTRPLPLQKIKTYTIKEGMMKAIIFITKKGLKFCADPKAKWVQEAVISIDGRSSVKKSMAKTVPTRVQRSTSTAMFLSG